MRKLVLPAKQIIGIDEVGDPHLLKVYFSVFNHGHGDDLPPSIVVNKNMVEENALDKYVRPKEVESFFRALCYSDAKYLLLDGHHRVVAGELCHLPLNFLEVCRDEDLKKLSSMEETGGIFSFPHAQTSVSKMASSFAFDFFGRRLHLRGIQTIDGLVGDMVRNGELPEYMAKKYRGE